MTRRRARFASALVVVVAAVVLVGGCVSGPSETATDGNIAIQVDGWNQSTTDFLAELDQVAANPAYVDARTKANGGAPFNVFRPGTREPVPEVAVEFLNERVSFRLVEQELRRRNVAITDADRDQALVLLGSTLLRQSAQPAPAPGEPAPAPETTPTTAPAPADAKRLGQQVLDGFSGSYRQVLFDGLAGLVALQRTLSGGGEDQETQLRALYDKTKDQACVSHILVKAGENAGKADPQTGEPVRPTDADFQAALVKATQLRTQIVGGADFAATATANSDDPGSKDAGGDLGCQARGVYLDALDNAIWLAEPGTVSEPVKTDYGYHLVLVRERKTPTFEEERPRLEEALASQQASALQSWLQEAAPNARVVVNPAYGVWDPQRGTVVLSQSSSDLTLAPMTPTTG